MKFICLTTDISTIGGIERTMATICNYLIKNYNYNIEIVSLYEIYREKPAFNLDNNIKLSYYNFKVIEPKSFKDKVIQNLKQAKLIKKILKQKDYDILITFHPHISIPAIIFKNDKKIIVTEHSDYDNTTIIWKCLRKLFYKNANKVVVLTQENKKKYKQFTSENLCVIPNSIPFSVDKNSSLNNNRIIAVGRLEKEKGFDRLVEISKIILNKYDNWIIDIIGEGSEYENLNNLIMKNNLKDKLRILKFTNNIEEEYLKSDICVVPSRSEAFPMVILEAMQCGLPVISFNISGTTNLIENNKTGILVKNNDIKQFSKEIIKLIDNKELRKQYGESGKIKSEKYSINNIGKQWDEILRGLR